MTIGNEPPLTPQQQMRNAITPYEFGVLEGKLHGAHQLLRKKLEKRQQWAVMWIILGGMAILGSLLPTFPGDIAERAWGFLGGLGLLIYFTDRWRTSNVVRKGLSAPDDQRASG